LISKKSLLLEQQASQYFQPSSLGPKEFSQSLFKGQASEIFVDDHSIRIKKKGWFESGSPSKI
jgi:hypothetical protein